MKMVSLSGANYHFWKGKMKDLLFVNYMYFPIFDDVWLQINIGIQLLFRGVNHAPNVHCNLIFV